MFSLSSNHVGYWCSCAFLTSYTIVIREFWLTWCMVHSVNTASCCSTHAHLTTIIVIHGCILHQLCFITIIIYPYRWCCCRWTWSSELCLWWYVCQLQQNLVSLDALFVTCIGWTTSTHNSSSASTIAFILAVIKLEVELLKLRYLDYLRNWMKWVETPLYVFSMIFVAIGPHFDHWIWQLGVLTIFLGWIVLIGYLQQWPFTGVYILMLVHIIKSFLKVAFLALLLVVAFALTFYMQFFQLKEMVSQPSFELLYTFFRRSYGLKESYIHYKTFSKLYCACQCAQKCVHEHSVCRVWEINPCVSWGLSWSNMSFMTYGLPCYEYYTI